MTTSLVPNRAARALKSWFGRDPFPEMQADMDSMLSLLSGRWNGMAPVEGFSPSLNLSETNSEVRITMDVPGMKPEEIDVEVTGDRVRIRGEHKEEKEEKGRTFHRIERRTGSFSRFVELPSAVNEEKIAAEYRDGVLTLILPKAEEAKTHRVTVKANGK